MPNRFVAGRANYPGQMLDIVGEVKGPTTFGTLVVAVTASHDIERDRTTVMFATCTDADHDLIARTREARIPFETVTRPNLDGPIVREALSW